MKKLFVFCLLFLLFALSSCKPTQLIIHDIEYRDKLKHDSIYVEKNKTVTITTKGDSVFIHDLYTEYKYVDKFKTDSFFKYKEKPVYSIITKTVKVDKPLSWYNVIFLIIGKWFSGLFLLVVIYMAIKYFSDIKQIFIKKL